SRIHLSHAQLLALVEGMDWKRVHAVTESRPQSAG
ncbi:transposase, partial [Devosia soli]